MSKKDYIAIASAFQKLNNDIQRWKNLPESYSDAEVGLCIHLVERLAGYLAISLSDDNPRFNRDLFLQECRKGIK